MSVFEKDLQPGETFSVYLIFPDDSSHLEAQGLEMEEAVNLAYSHTKRPAAIAGITKEVRITDQLDNLVFQWINGQGVVWPKKDT